MGKNRERLRKSRKRKKIGSKWVPAVLITAVLSSGTLPAAAAPGFIFEDWETERGAGEGDSASASEALCATPAEAVPATAAEAVFALKSSSSLGDLWDDWDGDFSFLNGESGDGSRERPYQIRTKHQLMGLSLLAAMGMRIQPGEGDTEIIGSYDGSYFKLMANLDLGGMEWNPIGFYRDSSEVSGEVEHKFFGHFDGNGKTISNFRLNRSEWPNVGFFGAVEDAVIENLTLSPGKTVTGRNNVGILAGNVKNSRIADCTVRGAVSAAGTAGGIAGIITGNGSETGDGVIENCLANVTISVNGGSDLYAGGISGKAAGAAVVDCRVETGDNQTARIQGTGACVGGITGLQNDTDIYNSYVSGTIGGAGTLIVGGITGKYASGKLKTARFEGTIGQSGTGSAGHRGTFIGHREAGNYFRYGEDVAYLFADSEAKIAANVCGSGIPDDNEYTYGDHIGFSHSGDLFYTLVQGGVTREVTDTCYYEELEDGILHIIEEELGGGGAEEAGYEIDHFAPNDAGRPTRGYLVTIPQIDTVSNGTNYYDVAVLEARGNGSYYRTLGKEHRGAIAPGRSVTVTTSPKQTEDAKFQMEGVPVYTQGGKIRETTYEGGGEYTFTMPAENTEVRAVYKKVAVKVSVIPSQYRISVVEERTGDRKNPVKTTRVLDQDGRLIATYINGMLEQGTQIQPVSIRAVVDQNNDVADSSVKWSIDDADLLPLLPNDDMDAEGYTNKSASLQVNLKSSFLSDTIRRLEKEQAEAGYQYPIPDTIFGAGHQNGGVAILTASTRPAVSFEGKPCSANARINVTFQVKDQTYVAGEGAALDKTALNFTVTRKLTGNRKNPEEAITVTAPQSLSASFYPDFFDKKQISWTTDDPAILSVNGENKSASAAARKDAKWIRDIMASDDGIHENDPYALRKGSGMKKAKITVIGDDMLGNKRTASCDVTVRFETVDETRILAEGIHLSPSELHYRLSCKKTGSRSNPTVSWTGNTEKQAAVSVYPEQAWNRNYTWKISDDSLFVSKDGTVTVNPNAGWIEKINRVYPYKGTHTAVMTAVAEDGGFRAACRVTIEYQMTDETYSRGSSGGSGSSSGGSGNAGPSGVSTGALATGPAADTVTAGQTVSAADGTAVSGSGIPLGSMSGIWEKQADGRWKFYAGGRSFRNEWAYVYNPYAGVGQASADWFRFDENGYMVTGWFTDSDGHRYYLWPHSDGTQGHMATGWQWIAGLDGTLRRYYFHTVSDGTRGHLLKNETTPDGEAVNSEGEWTKDGMVQTKKEVFDA